MAVSAHALQTDGQNCQDCTCTSWHSRKCVEISSGIVLARYLDNNNNNNNPICKAPECQKTSVALADRNSRAN